VLSIPVRFLRTRCFKAEETPNRRPAFRGADWRAGRLERPHRGGGRCAHLLSELWPPGSSAAPIAASAKTITVNLLIPVSASRLSQAFQSFPFPGTLTGATLSLIDSLTWIAGGASGNDNSATLLVTLLGPIRASQMVVGSPGVVNRIEIDLNGNASSIGSGSQTEILSLSDGANGGGVSRTILEGTVTYDFTPLLGSAPPKPPPAPGAIPEPSTWAMMFGSFAGLGYAALRRKST
jgi:hypothetical protein